jgi:hypothetical protein
MGAGCIPITPASGGGAEMLEEIEGGYTYRTIDEASQDVMSAFHSQRTQDVPDYVARKALVFSSEQFEGRVVSLMSRYT